MSRVEQCVNNSTRSTHMVLLWLDESTADIRLLDGNLTQLEPHKFMAQALDAGRVVLQVKPVQSQGEIVQLQLHPFPFY